ncbi:MAG: response regulator [Proteobacteria bacterium]|nr:response regulator [Pseudomonadota bacterium]
MGADEKQGRGDLPPEMDKACVPGTRVDQLSAFQLYHLNKYAEIGMALSGEENVDRLLEMIIHEARAITDADAGTLYLVNESGTHLDFVILQNDTMNTRMGGTSGEEINLPPVPLMVDGKPNRANVSSHVALSGDIVNIADVYESEDFDFTGPRKYDEATGYRSKSMLVIPMRNHENDIIGVLQLLNAQDIAGGGCISEFSDDRVVLVASLASQAAAALTKTRLIKDLKDLFYAFIKSIANAIEEKSPYTGGHINRVVDISMLIARKINEIDDGPFADTHFNEDELEELKLSAWLHDIGKIITPEWVVDKASKLQTIYDRVDLVSLRFDLIAKSLEADCLALKVEQLTLGTGPEALAELDARCAQALEDLAAERTFVMSCNEPGEFMSDERIARVGAIAAKTYALNGQQRPYLTEDELQNLCIRKGTLTGRERVIIENHASMTGTMLSELPFPKKLSRVPEYASSHHEKLDGSGYPKGLKDDALPLQARIMAVADIFEALTAKDRPYKKPLPLSQAVKILGFMKKDRHIDPEVHDLFLSTGLFREYAELELNPDQFDEVKVPPDLTKRPVLVAGQGDFESLTGLLTAWGAILDMQPSLPTAELAVIKAYQVCKPYRVVFIPADEPGWELAAQLGENEGFPMHSLVMVSAAPGDSDRQQMQSLGLGGLIALPVQEGELSDVVFSLINGHRYSEGVNPALCLMGKARQRARQESRGLSILVVDDSANTRMLIKYYLADKSYCLEIAENGRDGVEAYTKSHFDLVIMGTHLSGMDGFASARAIRQWEQESRSPQVPLLAITAHYIADDGQRSLDAGFTDYIERPFTKPKLLKLVEQYIGK